MKGTVKLSMNIPRELHRAAKAKAKRLAESGLPIPAVSVLRAWMVKGEEAERAEGISWGGKPKDEGKGTGTADEGGGAGGVRGAAPGDGRDGAGDRASRRAKDSSS